MKSRAKLVREDDPLISNDDAPIASGWSDDLDLDIDGDLMEQDEGGDGDDGWGDKWDDATEVFNKPVVTVTKESSPRKATQEVSPVLMKVESPKSHGNDEEEDEFESADDGGDDDDEGEEEVGEGGDDEGEEKDQGGSKVSDEVKLETKPIEIDGDDATSPPLPPPSVDTFPSEDSVERDGALHPVDGEKRLLLTKHLMYVPETQDCELVTEDMMKEQEEKILKLLGSASSMSQSLHTQIQSQSLFSDMQAFKAANPGCIVEDFVRWHSPKDWTDDASERGKLSERMANKENIWHQLWSDAKPLAACRQALLFDFQTGKSAMGEISLVILILLYLTPKSFLIYYSQKLRKSLIISRQCNPPSYSRSFFR